MSKSWRAISLIVLIAILVGALFVGVGRVTGGSWDRIYSSLDSRYWFIDAYLNPENGWFVRAYEKIKTDMGFPTASAAPEAPSEESPEAVPEATPAAGPEAGSDAAPEATLEIVPGE